MKKILSLFTIIFTLFFFVSCSDDYKMTIVGPSGAPSIAVAQLAKESEDYEFNLGVDPTLLQSYFVNNSADAIIAPINLGSKMYTNNHNYVLASILTWGNLFFASQKEFTLSDLNNNDVIFFGENTINMAVVNYILSQNNITPNITYLGSTSLTQAELLNSNSIVLIAEPALSVAKNKKEIFSISVQEEFKKLTNIEGFPQAGLFIRQETITNHKSKVDKFISEVKASANKATTDLELVAQYSEELSLGGKKEILVRAIPNCSIKFTKANDTKDILNTFVNISSIKPFFGVLEDGFYY